MSDHLPKVRRRPLERGDLERMAIPEEFWRAKLQECPENVRPTLTAYGQRLHELAPRGIGLFLAGVPGVGKTAAACVLAKEARIQGLSTYFTTFWGLREAIRNRVPFDNDMTVIERVQTCGFLVLDTFKLEDANEMILGHRAVEEILVGRASNGRPSVLTGQALFAQLDDVKAGWRGLLQRGRLHHLTLTGPDRRVAEYQNLGKIILPPGRNAT